MTTPHIAALTLFGAKGREHWMTNPNSRLEGLIPSELIAKGEGDKVLALLRTIQPGWMEGTLRGTR